MLSEGQKVQKTRKMFSRSTTKFWNARQEHAVTKPTKMAAEEISLYFVWMTQKLRKEEFGRLKLKIFPGEQPPDPKERVPKLEHCQVRAPCVSFDSLGSTIGHIPFVMIAENKNNGIWELEWSNFRKFRTLDSGLSRNFGFQVPQPKKGSSQKMNGLRAPNQKFQGSRDPPLRPCAPFGSNCRL